MGIERMYQKIKQQKNIIAQDLCVTEVSCERIVKI